MAARKDLNGNEIKPIKICMIGGGGFIGSHLCEALMWETEHSVIAIDVYSDKIEHLLQDDAPWASRIRFYQANIKHDPRVNDFVKECDLVSLCGPVHDLDAC